MKTCDKCKCREDSFDPPQSLMRMGHLDLCMKDREAYLKKYGDQLDLIFDLANTSQIALEKKFLSEP